MPPNLRSNSVTALAAPDQAPQDMFENFDPSLIDFPDKTTPVEAAYHQTIDLNPDQAAKVVNIAKQTGQLPEFVGMNMDAAAKAANTPPSEYFADIVKKFPRTAEFLSAPANMAMAKDDIENLKKTEALSQEHGFMGTVDRYATALPYAFKAIVDNMKSEVGVVPNILDPSEDLLPVNKIIGTIFDHLTQLGGGGDQSYRPFLKDKFPRTYNTMKAVGEFAGGLTSKTNLALMAGMGLGGEFLAGMPRAGAAIGAITSGGFAAMMAKDDPEIYRQMQAAHVRGDVGEVWRLGTLGALNTLMAAFAVKEVGSNLVDLGAEHVSNGMEMPAMDQYDPGGKYSEIMKTIAESKFAGRSDDSHREYLGKLGMDDVMIPARDFDTYFQGKNINPNEMGARLGISDQQPDAREINGDLKIPFEKFAGELAKTPHAEGLKPYIRWNEGMPTVNENTAARELIGKQMDDMVKQADESVKAAQAANPGWEEGRQKVQDQFMRQLVASKAYSPKDAEVQAQAGAKIIERLAATTGEADPAAYLANHPIEIVNGRMVPAEGELKQSAIPGEKAFNPKEPAMEVTPELFDKFYTPTTDPAEQADSKWVRDNLKTFAPAYAEEIKKEFKTKVANIVSADTAKTVKVEGRPDFTSEMSSQRHEGGSAFAKAFYHVLLSNSETKHQDVLVLAGGAGVGKTSGLKAQGADTENYAAVYDTNLASEKSGKNIINDALASGREAQVLYVDRDPIKAFEDGVYKRFQTHDEHRIVPIEVFLNTLGAKDAIPKLLEDYKGEKKVNFSFVDNNGGKGEARGVDSFEELPKTKYNIEEIRSQLNEFIRGKEKSGEITAEQAAAFLAERPDEVVRPGAESGGVGRRGAQQGQIPATQLAQAAPEPGDPITNPRASISFGLNKAIINLRAADPSSFMHEMSHYWLKNFSDFMQSGAPNESHIADWNTLTKFLDIKPGQKDLTVEQQEKFARGFEKYLYEGQPPSEGLRGVFNKFRTWLTNLYRDPSVLNVELNPEVRGVMDRMLASEDEIKFAERDAGITDLWEYSKLGIEPKVIAKLGALREEAHDSAFQELFKKQMDEISQENQKKLVNEVAGARAKAEETIRGSDVQTAIQAVQKTFGGDPLKTARDFWLGKMKDETRGKFEQLAEARGFSCGDEMAQKIVKEPPVEKQVQAAVDQHMAQFADLKDTDKIKEAALAAVHNEKSIELMAREESIFRGLVDQAQGRLADQKLRAEQARMEAAYAKIKAERVISAQTTTEARKFLPYFTAERNAAIRVKKALMDGDYEAAAKAKHEQMLNHALVREAYAYKQEYARDLRFFDRFASRGIDLKNVPYGFIRQIDNLLSDHGLSDPKVEDATTHLKMAQDMQAAGEYPDEIAHRTGWTVDDAGNWKQETLPDVVNRIQNDYRNLYIPDSILTIQPKDYRAMKVADFRDLKTAVKAINAVGRGYDNFLDENIKMDKVEAAAKFRAETESEIGQKYREGRLPGSKHGETIFNRTADAFNKARGILTPSLTNLYSYCYFLDGGKEDGLMMNLVYRPLEHALNDNLKKDAVDIKEMKKIIKDHWTEKEYANQKKEKVYIKSLDRDYTLDQVQAFANNQGTLIGRDRANNLIDGGKITPEQRAEILSHVTKNMWDYAQAIWDHNDKHWPEIVAQQEKVAGESPQKVVAEPVETPYGTYRGGYYPLKYDRAKSNEAIKPIDERNALYKTQGAVAAHTDHGFTISRVQNYGQPVNLDTRIEYTHLEDVNHDLSHRQPIIDVSSFLRQKDTREAIINAIGREGYDTIQQHVKWVAADQGEYLNGISDKLLQRLRFGSTIATLGLRPATAPIFLASNTINAIRDLGPLNFGHAIMDFLWNREANVQLINQMIPAMEHRSTLMDRDLNDMDKSAQGFNRLMSHLLFYPHQKADQAITYPLALHVYKNAVGEFGEQKARDMAYEAVTGLAGDGSTLGQAMIQRGSESQKMWAWWYSWAGTQFNRLWRDGKIAGLEYDKGNIGMALSLLGTSLFFGVGLQGANEAFWKDIVFHNSLAESDEKKKARMAMRIPNQLLSYVPVIGPIAQYGLNKSMGSQKGLDMPAVQSLETLTDPMWDWAKEKYTGRESPHFWEDTAKSAAMIARYPQYINTVAFNVLDDINGNGEATWKDLFTRKTKH